MANINTSDDLLQCPLTLELCHDPDIAQDGHTYERQAIEKWIRAEGTSPITRQPLFIEQLYPNRKVKELVEVFETSLRQKSYQFTLDVDVKKRRDDQYFTHLAKRFMGLSGYQIIILNIISIRYAAPEVLASNATSEVYTGKSDIYSMGVLMWEAYSRGALPWSDIEHDEDVIRRVRNVDLLPRPSDCSQPFWLIIIKTWSTLPKHRPTFSELKYLLLTQYCKGETSYFCTSKYIKIL